MHATFTSVIHVASLVHTWELTYIPILCMHMRTLTHTQAHTHTHLITIYTTNTCMHFIQVSHTHTHTLYQEFTYKKEQKLLQPEHCPGWRPGRYNFRAPSRPILHFVTLVYHSVSNCTLLVGFLLKPCNSVSQKCLIVGKCRSRVVGLLHLQES